MMLLTDLALRSSVILAIGLVVNAALGAAIGRAAPLRARRHDLRGRRGRAVQPVAARVGGPDCASDVDRQSQSGQPLPRQ